jgi:hypothetical protein
VQVLVREPVYNAYWSFAASRQDIFHRRALGQPWPWSADPILRKYRFCNVYRASDRISQYLIREAIHSKLEHDLEPEDVFLRIVLFRLFSKESTWEALERASGGIARATLNIHALGKVLDGLKAREPIYTAAFILAAHDVYGYRTKHRNHLELVSRMFRPGKLGRRIARARTLQELFEALREWPLIGPFMAYQLAVDLNYSPHLDFSENSFTVAGPGAIRGIRKVFRDPRGQSPERLILGMVDRQEDEFGRLGLPWRDLFGRRLHAIDCQNLFCELDKYSRVAFPELASNRKRIKQTFTASPHRLSLFYPPKWDINGRLPTEAALADPQQLNLFAGNGRMRRAPIANNS